MRKLISILTTVILLLTTVFVTGAFNTSAQTVEDNARLNIWRDETGKQVELFASSLSAVPSNITESNFTLAENTSKLPLTSLFSYSLPVGTTVSTPRINLSQQISASEAKGAIFYIEIPALASGAESFALGVNFTGHGPVTEQGKFNDLNKNDISGERIEDFYWTAYKYGYRDYYIRSAEASEWTSTTLSNYSINLASGWKGYVMVPFDVYDTTDGSFPQHIDEGFNITGIELRNVQNIAGALIISEPIWLLGAYNETTHCEEFHSVNGAYKDELTIDGVEYNYNTGKAAESVIRPDASGITVAMHKQYSSTSVNLTSGNSGTVVAPGLRTDRGTRSEISSISPLTDLPSCSTTNIIHYDNSGMKDGKTQVAAFNLASETTLPTGGFLVYADIPELNGNVKFYTALYNGSTMVGYIHYSNSSSSTKSFYVMRDGEKAWEEINIFDQKTYSYAYLNTADATTGKSSFKGWIYLPAKIYRTGSNGADAVAATAVFDSITFSIDPYRYTTASNAADKAALENPVKFSAVTAITAFDSTKTLVVGDGNKIVDLKTNEEISIDYTGVTKEYVGNANLINNRPEKDKVIALNNINFTKEIAFSGVQPTLGNTITSYQFDNKTLDSVKYINSSCVISKMPSLDISATLGTTRNYMILEVASKTETDKQINMKAIDGFMFYVKVDNNAQLSLNFSVACTGADTGHINYYTSKEYQILQNGDTEWKWSKGGTPTGVSQLPAGFEGYVYVPKDSSHDVEGATAYHFYVWAGAAMDSTVTDFELGPIMTVQAGTWTTENAGIAFANGNAVAQDMFTGDFRVVNDLDFDMNVDLIDLIRAKESYGEERFLNFRRDYMTDYFFVAA